MLIEELWSQAKISHEEEDRHRIVSSEMSVTTKKVIRTSQGKRATHSHIGLISLWVVMRITCMERPVVCSRSNLRPSVLEAFLDEGCFELSKTMFRSSGLDSYRLHLRACHRVQGRIFH